MSRLGKSSRGEVLGKFSFLGGGNSLSPLKKKNLLVYSRIVSLLGVVSFQACGSFGLLTYGLHSSKVLHGHTSSLLERLLCLSCVLGLLTLMMTQGCLKISNVVYGQI